MLLEYLAVAAVALVAAALTLFSGFGLGTLLMPALALLFPVPVAVAATAVVHLANNLFKLALVGRAARRDVVLRFGMVAALAALVGAAALAWLAELPVLADYRWLGREWQVESVKLVAGLLIVAFALLEISPRAQRLEFSPRLLPLGGALSGFFGGLTGNQGALRAAFLIRAGLDKTAFVGTSVVCAVIVDTVRIAAYGSLLPGTTLAGRDGLWPLVAVAVLAAFAGSYLGVRLLGKVTLRFVQLTVAAMMLLVGGGLAAGLL